MFSIRILVIMIALSSSFLIAIQLISNTSTPWAVAQNFVLSEEKPTISIVGYAEKEIPSDETRISLSVENTNTNANTARKNNADKMNAILDVLKQAGLRDDNITTSNFQITPNYDYETSN